jgi:hypothetical protein
LWLRWLLSHSADKLKFNIWSVPKGEDISKCSIANFQPSTFQSIRGARGSNPLANASVQRNILIISEFTIC